MNDLLMLILKNITTHPEDINVSESMDGDKKVFTIKVHDEDMGRVIGKDGKVIRAIRSIAHVAGIRAGEHFIIRLEDGENPPVKSEETVTESQPETTESPDSKADDLIAGSIDMDAGEKAEE